MRKFIIAAAFVLVPVTAVHAMSIATFLQKADALKARGVMALMSSDISLLKNTVVTASQELKTERETAVRAGRRPAFCPPQGARASLNSDQLLAHFRSYPEAQRGRTHVRDGLRDLLARRYPCPAA